MTEPFKTHTPERHPSLTQTRSVEERLRDAEQLLIRAYSHFMKPFSLEDMLDPKPEALMEDIHALVWEGNRVRLREINAKKARCMRMRGV